MHMQHQRRQKIGIENWKMTIIQVQQQQKNEKKRVHAYGKKWKINDHA